MKSRHQCPACNKENIFSRYINTDTGSYVSSEVGRCNREENCGYHLSPKQYFKENNISFEISQSKQFIKPKIPTSQVKPISFIPTDIFKASRRGFNDNKFVQYLTKLFGMEVTKTLIEKYCIGSSNHWEGSTVFYQIDFNGDVRTGKIMLYNPMTGKRIKEPFNHIHWAHKALKQPDFNLKQCLFGEHLLQNNKNPIAVVESEKSAIIAAGYLPQFTWVAVGGKQGLNIEKCKILNKSNKPIILFPDISKPKEGEPTAFESWKKIANEHLSKYTISNLLEIKATEEERVQGLDIADYLLKFDYLKFISRYESNINDISVSPFSEHSMPVSASDKINQIHDEELINQVDLNFSLIEQYMLSPEQPNTDNWDESINELESFFKNRPLLLLPIKLNSFITISAPAIFVESHLCTVRAQNGKRTYLPFLERLQELKELLLR